MEHGPGWGRTGSRGKKAKSKEVEVKRLPEKAPGIENMLMRLKKKKIQGEPSGPPSN